jgi:hypothetical protein
VCGARKRRGGRPMSNRKPRTKNQEPPKKTPFPSQHLWIFYAKFASAALPADRDGDGATDGLELFQKTDRGDSTFDRYSLGEKHPPAVKFRLLPVRYPSP